MMIIDPEMRVDHRIVSTDPGTNTLGVAVLKIRENDILVEHATTFQIGKMFTKYPLIVEKHGDRVAKLHATTDSLLKFYETWQPTYLASEGPYLGSFATAFAALVECVDAIRRAVIQYDPYKGLNVTDPASVKKSIGVSGKSSDKELMRQALKQQKILTFHPDVDIDALDEHSVDAIAVGLCFYLTHLSHLKH